MTRSLLCYAIGLVFSAQTIGINLASADQLDTEIEHHACFALRETKSFNQFYDTARTALIRHSLNQGRIAANDWFIRKEAGNAKLLYYGDVTSKFLFIAGIALLPNVVFVDAFGLAAVANATSGTAASLILSLPVLGMLAYAYFPEQDKTAIVSDWDTHQLELMDAIRVQNASRNSHDNREMHQLSSDPQNANNVAHILEDNLATFREALNVTEESWNKFIQKNHINSNHEPAAHIALREAETEIFRRENVYLESFSLALDQFCAKARDTLVAR